MPFDWPGEKFFIKLVETFEKGVGALASPWQIKREGLARAEVLALEKLALAQAEVEVERIRAGEIEFREGKLVALPPPPKKDNSLIEYVHSGQESTRLIGSAKTESDYLNLRRSINLRRIAIMAAEQSPDIPDADVSDEQVDPDWFARWRRAAQDVTNEDMQQLWAKLLAGEAKMPGSFSVQTVNLVASLSRDQATWIAKLAPLLIKDWIFKDDAFLTKCGIGLMELLELSHLGVVTGIESIGGLVHKPSFGPSAGEPGKSVVAYATGPKAIIFMHSDPVPSLDLPIYIVLRAGRELISLCKVEPNVEYLRVIGKFAKEKGFEVGIGDVNHMPGNMLRVTNVQEI